MCDLVRTLVRVFAMSLSIKVQSVPFHRKDTFFQKVEGEVVCLEFGYTQLGLLQEW